MLAGYKWTWIILDGKDQGSLDYFSHVENGVLVMEVCSVNISVVGIGISTSKSEVAPTSG